MSDINDELSLKLLERTAEQFQSARGAFYRDLKIGVFLLLAFLCFVFVPFGRLSRERLQVDVKLAQTLTNYVALTNLHARVAGLSDGLSESASNMLVQVRGLPIDLRAGILALEKEVLAFRSQTQMLASAAAAGSRAGGLMLQTAPSTLQSDLPNAAFRRHDEGPPPLPPRFRSMSPADLKTLHQAPTNSAPFLTSVDRLVDSTVVAPAFQELNQQWQTKLARPFAEARAMLLAQSNDLARVHEAGLVAPGFTGTLAKVEQQLLAYRFIPPSSSTWWTTYVGKTGQAESMSLDARRAAESVKQNVKTSEQQLRESKARVTDLLRQTEAWQRSTEAELLQVQTNAMSLQSAFERYVTPLPYVELKPREVVLYFPALIVLAYAFFAGRQMLLRRRAAQLTTAYAGHGVSGEVRAMMFSAPQSPRQRLIPLMLWIAIAVVATTTAWQLRANEALQPDLPRQIFLLAGVVLFVVGAAELYGLRQGPGLEKG